MPVEHPVEVHPVIDRVGQMHDFCVVLEVLPGGQDAAHQEGGVDRGQFAFLSVPGMKSAALARADIHAMVEPAPFVRRVMGEELQGVAHPGAGQLRIDPLAGGPDADGGQAEAGRGDAADLAPLLRMTTPGRALARQAGVRVGLLPEIEEGAFGQIMEE